MESRADRPYHTRGSNMSGKAKYSTVFKELGENNHLLRDRPGSHNLEGTRAARILCSCSSACVHDGVLSVLRRGGFIGLGATSDGGALSVTVIIDRKRRRAH